MKDVTYRVVLCSGEQVELRHADMVDGGDGVLMFFVGEATYRFNWLAVAYVVCRPR